MLLSRDGGVSWVVSRGLGGLYLDQSGISFAGSGRNVGSVRNPLPFKGFTDASGN
jgi:hypothetical protein